MDRRLIEAAHKGDVHQLQTLIKDDPFLMKAVALSRGETPLHIACMAGNLSFAKEVLNLSPEFAKELSHDGFSPLHIAAGNGDIEIVKELLIRDRSLCMVKGNEMRIPLHYAVIKGRIEVIKELLSANEGSIRKATARGENSLHLAVKNNQFEAFKSLAVYLKTNNREDIFNEKDARGNTILHLAVSRKQYEVVELMLDENFVRKGLLEVNSLNKMDRTPLDVLLSEGGDDEIEEMLCLAGASVQQTTQTENGIVPTHDPNDELRRERPRKPYEKLQEYFKFDKAKETPSEVRSVLLVVATLITTATYQAVHSPPGGVWQEDFRPTSSSNTTTIKDATRSPAHTAGKAVMGTQNSAAFGLFLIFNSIGFFTSVQMIFFLTFGFPLQLELRASLFALAVTYDTCMTEMATGNLSVLFVIISIAMPLLIGILAKVARDYCKKPTSASWTA
ncbi:ankyrin repeat-containing protein BDA1-like isoform X2 [Olea europaea var. sylvestris]|uniref:Ankyrin repeat-containing BDA1-like n=1 Tax=Olea europaea subsp. europaea TaxID=158383 RepID=A0A8S0U6P3_OLEEU|nr:ankyrin repeat-containing protein BDA1-like isoform X2 [Olea europaea var. sylvestris]CAA3013090.1 ankyrin repeat-containing BDA1-like [Olea europaea subsp. europaea]